MLKMAEMVREPLILVRELELRGMRLNGIAIVGAATNAGIVIDGLTPLCSSC